MSKTAERGKEESSSPSQPDDESLAVAASAEDISPTSPLGSSDDDSSSIASSSSVRSKASQIKAYMLHDLFIHDPDRAARSKYISSTDEDRLTLSKYPFLKQRIEEVKTRGISKVTEGDRSSRNLISMTVICYNKSDLHGTLREFEVQVPGSARFTLEDRTSQYPPDVKERIFAEERVVIIKKMRERLDRVQAAIDDGVKKFSAQIRAEHQIEAQMTELRQARHVARSQKNLTEIDDISEQLTLLNTERLKMRRDAQGYMHFMKQRPILEKEEEKLTEWLDPKNSQIVDDAIREFRGHSEDYLLDAIKYEGVLREAVAYSQSVECDRVYVVITSTNDPCRRCQDRVEEVVIETEKQLNPSRTEGVVCKGLYFGSKLFMDKNGGTHVDYQEGKVDNLSDEEDIVVIGIKLQTASTPKTSPHKKEVKDSAIFENSNLFTPSNPPSKFRTPFE